MVEPKLVDIPAGTLVRFVCAPARWSGEAPRPPGNDLLGQLAITVTTATPDDHGWGGFIYLNTVRGESFTHYGDFLEVIE